ncbi:MAG: AmmeMemoRadiSam system protein B [Deltaproteobacteria bacterium]|nr:AmmeMemoRadiSam system protein B [Deltaproteobacteria bacterium]
MINQNNAKNIRPPAVASMFYPVGAAELRKAVQNYLSNAGTEEDVSQFKKEEFAELRTLIVPHAGYIYSGKIAASAYRLLEQNKNQFKRVLLLGPAHRVLLEGAAFPEKDAFETPLGEITLDKELIEKILAEFSWISVSDKAHAEEHCLEVQLPFLQETLGEFKLLPLVVGDAKTELLAALIQQFSKDHETLIVISTDLSHFHDYETAREIDGRTANAIELLEQNRISTEDACGAYPLRGALLAASQNQWKVHRLGLCNSGDTAGDRGRVVGYGAWAMTA